MNADAMVTPPSKAKESCNIISSPMSDESIIAHRKTQYQRKVAASPSIKVTIHIPKNVFEPIRQQKINQIYDILNPKALNQK